MADDDLLMTRADYQKLEREIEQLETSARGEMAERIKAARELGDLKENAEYHDAKDAQAILETRILRLRDQLTRAQVVQAESGGDAIAFGSEVEVADRDSGKRSTYTLVSANEIRMLGMVAMKWADFGIPSPTCAGVADVRDNGQMEFLIVATR